MVSAKLLVVLLVLCVLVEEFEARRNRTRGAGRRNRNRNRNRNRGRGRQRGSAGNGCEEIQVPMCKGMVPYTHTKLPNRFSHTTQLQANRVLEHLWALIDRGCSENLRLILCSLYLPKCTRRGPGREPCAKTCKVTKRVCRRRLEQFGLEWPEQLNCTTFPKTRCVKQVAHQSCDRGYTECVPIDLPMCTGLTFDIGMSPNMFGQCNRTRISTEMSQFQPLIDTQCHPHLTFFLCGAYMPFCTHTEGVMSFPCRELCEEVQGACQAEYGRLSRGLTWPNKFQCHRYPSAASTGSTCVMPNEGGALSLA